MARKPIDIKLRGDLWKFRIHRCRLHTGGQLKDQYMEIWDTLAVPFEHQYHEVEVCQYEDGELVGVTFTKAPRGLQKGKLVAEVQNRSPHVVRERMDAHKKRPGITSCLDASRLP